jgi:hypothetical protein
VIQGSDKLPVWLPIPESANPAGQLSQTLCLSAVAEAKAFLPTFFALEEAAQQVKTSSDKRKCESCKVK